jgi:hypothetical protein
MKGLTMPIEYMNLKMRCLSDAFEGDNNRNEIARILRKLAGDLQRGELPVSGFDWYGNSCLSVEYQIRDEDGETREF